MKHLSAVLFGALLAAIAASSGCGSEVVEPDGAGGQGASAGTSAEGGGYGGFTCVGMCADFEAKFPQCYEDQCLMSCRGGLTQSEEKGCVEEAVACLERFPIDASGCSGGCLNNQAWTDCLQQ